MLQSKRWVHVWKTGKFPAPQIKVDLAKSTWIYCEPISQGSIRSSDTYFPNAHFLDIVTTSLCPSQSVVPAEGSSPSVISTECLMCAASVWTRIGGIFTSSRRGKTNWPYPKIRQRFLTAGQRWPLEMEKICANQFKPRRPSHLAGC